MRSIGVLGAVVIVVVLLFWAGVHNLHARHAAMDRNRVELVPAAAPGSADAAAPDAEGANLIDHAAPAFTLTSTDGRKVSLSDFKGHPVVVNFWATWCGPCKLEMPWFQEFSQKYQPQGLVVLGLSQDDGASRDDIATAAKKVGVSYPVLLHDDADHVSKIYGGVDYLPETFYIDKSGKVVTVTAGAPSKDQMEASIQKTIAAGNS